MSTSEILSAINIVVTILLGFLIAFLSYKLNRRLKAYEIWIGEVHELNVKMHDRLVEVEEAIKSDNRPSDNVKKRLLLNASRTIKYDETIYDDVHLLIDKYTEMFALKESGRIGPEIISKSKSDILHLIKTIKSKIDKVQEDLSK